MKNQRGLFITFEGIDGCGKSSQLKAISEWLPESGLLPNGAEVFVTKEPGSLPGIRDLLKDPKTQISALSELLLLMADRSHHVANEVEPQLEKGNWVLCDRFFGSTLAYQGFGRNLGYEIIKNAHELACPLYPDLEIILDINLHESAKRISARNENIDRFESQGDSFTTRVINGFMQTELKEYPSIMLDGHLSLECVTESCKNAITEYASVLYSL